MADQKVNVIYSLTDRASAGLSKLRSGFSMLAKVVGVATVAALGKAIFETAKFEKTITNVFTLLDKETFTKFHGVLREGSRQIIRDYGFAIEDTNKALFDTISAGIDAGQSVGFMNEAARLATGGVTQLSTAVNGMTALYNAYGDEIEDVSEITNALFTAQKFGRTTIEALSNNIGKVAPIAKVAGIGLEELLAITSQLTLKVDSTEEATTILRQTIQALINPGNEARELFESMGIPFGAAAVKGDNLAKTLKLISNQTDGNIDKLSKLIPNIRALTGVAALNNEALENYDKILNAVKTDTESLDRAVEMQTKTVAFMWQQFKGQLSVIGIRLAERFLPLMKDILSTVIDVFSQERIDVWTNSMELAVAELKLMFMELKNNFAKPLKDFMAPIVEQLGEMNDLVEEAKRKGRERSSIEVTNNKETLAQVAEINRLLKERELLLAKLEGAKGGPKGGRGVPGIAKPKKKPTIEEAPLPTLEAGVIPEAPTAEGLGLGAQVVEDTQNNIMTLQESIETWNLGRIEGERFVTDEMNRLRDEQSDKYKANLKKMDDARRANLAQELRDAETNAQYQKDFQKKRVNSFRGAVIANIAMSEIETMAGIEHQIALAIARGDLLGAALATAQLAIPAAIAGAKIAAVNAVLPKMQDGGIIPGTTRGTPIIAGERNQAEAIVPLEQAGGLAGLMPQTITGELTLGQEDALVKFVWRRVRTLQQEGRLEQ